MKWSRFALPLRVLTFVLGGALLAGGQFILYQTDSVVSLGQTAIDLNNTFHLDSLNNDNLLVGLPVALLGGLIASFGLLWPILPALPPIAETNDANPLPERPTVRARLDEYWHRHGFVIVITVILFALLIHQTSIADPTHTLVVLWFVSLALLIYLGVQWDRLSRVSLRQTATRRDWLIIGALLIFGFVVNGYALTSVPNSIIGDEAGFYERARIIAEGKDMFSMFDLGVYSYPLFSSEYQGAILAIFHETFWAWRFASVLISVLALIPTYLLALEIFDRRIAILSGITLLCLPWFIAFARMGYNNSQAILPVALSLFWLYVGVKRRSVTYHVLGAVAAGIGYYTYTAGRLALAVGGVYVLYMVVANAVNHYRHHPRPERRRIARQGIYQDGLLAAVFIGTSLLTIAPSVLYSNTTHPSLATYKTLESLFPNTTYARSIYTDAEMSRDTPLFKIGDQEYFYRLDLYANLLLRGVVRTVAAFNLGPGMQVSHYLTAPLAGLVGVPFYLLGLLLIFRHLFRRENFLLELWFFGGIFLLSIIHTFPVRYTHAVSVIPVLAIFIAVGLVSVGDLLFAVLRFFQKTAIPAATLTTVILLMIGANLYNYYVDMPSKYPPDLDSALGFTLLPLETPTEAVFLTTRPDRPAGYVPWLIVNLPNQVSFQTLRPETPMTVNTPTVHDLIVFSDDTALTATQQLMQKWFGAAVPKPTIVPYEAQSVLYEWKIPQGWQYKLPTPTLPTF